MIFGLVSSMPMLNIDGFTWAENLVFDGNGHLFVSDTVKAEIYKIELCENATSYCKSVYVHGGLKGIGGMQVSDDGSILYAGITTFIFLSDFLSCLFIGVTMEDGSTGIINTPTNTKIGISAYTLQFTTSHQPNGLALDTKNGNFYYCDEKSESIYAVNINTSKELVMKSEVKGADGLWLNINNGLLYAGELYSKKIHVFDTAKILDNNLPSYVQVYNGLSSLGFGSMLDDITIAHPGLLAPGVDTLYGCDFLGKAIYSFDINGNSKQSVDIKTATNGNLLYIIIYRLYINNIHKYIGGVTSLYNPTSVRYGKGIGFDPNSLYITEGGGITKRTSNRRVIQLKL